MNTQKIQAVMDAKPELAAKAADALRNVLSRSATDPDFRQRLLTDPRAAIPEVTGQPLPADYQVKFIENKADFTLVLPPPATQHVVELNEAELQSVSGGCTPVSGVVASVLSLISSAAWIVSEIMDHDSRHGSDICN